MFLYTLKGKTIASTKEKSCIQSEVMERHASKKDNTHSPKTGITLMKLKLPHIMLLCNIVACRLVIS
jgi:hypothetical protein